MHEHDLDLIAAAAAADPDADQQMAATLVATCDLCRQEWDAQRTAIAALAAAPRPILDDLERARLHRRVGAALETELPSTRPAQISPFTRRVLAVAGAAAAVVAVLGVGSLLRDGGGTVATVDQMAPEAGADLATANQSFDTEEDTATLQGGIQVPSTGGAESTESTAAAGGTESTAAAAGAADNTNRTASELAAIRLPEVSPSRLASRLLALRDREIGRDLSSEETALICVDRVGPDRPGSEIDLVALLTVGDDEVEVYVVVNDSGERAALAYRTSDCTLIAER
ncbi:MAG TPA: hypothetical protein VHM94_03735 [Acidimicrobiia bacterium]|nr:hypothetical protein [Acidimicrobiia bacterium]